MGSGRIIVEIPKNQQINLHFLDFDGNLEEGTILMGYHLKDAVEQYYANNFKNGVTITYNDLNNNMENQETPEQAHENKYPKTGQEYYDYFVEHGSLPLEAFKEEMKTISISDKISLIDSLSFMAGQEFTDEVSGVRRGLLSVAERKKLAGVVIKLSDQVLDEVCPDVNAPKYSSEDIAKIFNDVQ